MTGLIVHDSAIDVLPQLFPSQAVEPEHTNMSLVILNIRSIAIVPRGTNRHGETIV